MDTLVRRSYIEDVKIGNTKTGRRPEKSGPEHYMRPAFPTKVDGFNWLETLHDEPDTFNDPLRQAKLRDCPEGFSRSHFCNADGAPNPSCGTGQDSGVEEYVKFCARDEEHYEKQNIAECCLTRDENEEDFKRCPMDYCKSKYV